MAKANGTKKAKAGTAALHEALERRRKYPRIVIDSPASIKLDKNTVVNGLAHDVSIDGIQIRCDREAANKLHPSGKFIKEDKGPLVEVRFDLPYMNNTAPVTVTCQIYYLTVISRTEFAFGMSFRKFSDHGEELVEKLIMDQILPVEDRVRTFLVEPRTNRELSAHMNMQVNEVAEVLDRLQVKGEIISFDDGRDVRHLKLSAAMTTIFNTLDRLEQRLQRLEQSGNGK